MSCIAWHVAPHRAMSAAGRKLKIDETTSRGTPCCAKDPVRCHLRRLCDNWVHATRSVVDCIVPAGAAAQRTRHTTLAQPLHDKQRQRAAAHAFTHTARQAATHCTSSALRRFRLFKRLPSPHTLLSDARAALPDEARGTPPLLPLLSAAHDRRRLVVCAMTYNTGTKHACAAVTWR